MCVPGACPPTKSLFHSLSLAPRLTVTAILIVANMREADRDLDTLFSLPLYTERERECVKWRQTLHATLSSRLEACTIYVRTLNWLYYTHTFLFSHFSLCHRLFALDELIFFSFLFLYESPPLLYVTCFRILMDSRKFEPGVGRRCLFYDVFIM